MGVLYFADMFKMNELRRKLKKRVKRLTIAINGRDPRGRQNRNIFPRILPDIFEECRLSRARVPGDIKMAGSVFERLKTFFKIFTEIKIFGKRERTF